MCLIINIKLSKKNNYLYIQCMEIIGMKKKYSFTIEESLVDWFRVYVKEESTTMSGVLNQYILSLKRGETKPRKILYSNRKSH